MRAASLDQQVRWTGTEICCTTVSVERQVWGKQHDQPEALAKALRLGKRAWDRRLRVARVALVLDKRKVDVVILRLSTHSQSTSLESWEENAHQLSKASGIENGDSLRGAARRIVGVDATTRDRTLALGTNRIDPDEFSIACCKSRKGAGLVPEHSKNLARPFRVWTALIAMQLTSNVLECAMAVSAKQLPHLKLIVGARPGGGLGRTDSAAHEVSIVVVVPVQHLGVAVSKARIGAVLLIGQRMAGHGVLLLRVLLLVGHVVVRHGRRHGVVHGEVVISRLHVGGSLHDHHLLGGHLCRRVHGLVVGHPLAGIHTGSVGEARVVHVRLGRGAVDGCR